MFHSSKASTTLADMLHGPDHDACHKNNGNDAFLVVKRDD